MFCFFRLKWLGKQSSFLIAEVIAMKGYKVQPLPRVPRHDTVQAVQLGNHECLLAFCEAVQRSSPVGSFTKLIASATPGYASEIWPSLALFVTMQCLILATLLFFAIMFGD